MVQWPAVMRAYVFMQLPSLRRRGDEKRLKSESAPASTIMDMQARQLVVTRTAQNSCPLILMFLPTQMGDVLAEQRCIGMVHQMRDWPRVPKPCNRPFRWQCATM